MGSIKVMSNDEIRWLPARFIKKGATKHSLKIDVKTLKWLEELEEITGSKDRDAVINYAIMIAHLHKERLRDMSPTFHKS